MITQLTNLFTNIGVSFEAVFLFMVFGISLIASVRDIRIGLIIGFMLSSFTGIFFYMNGMIYQYAIYLAMLCIVMLAFSLKESNKGINNQVI